MTTDRFRHAEHFYLFQNLAQHNGFGDISEKLLSVPYVLFLVMAAMFLTDQKSSHQLLCRIPQETFISSLVSIGQVVSEEKIFEKIVNDDRRK